MFRMFAEARQKVELKTSLLSGFLRKKTPDFLSDPTYHGPSLRVVYMASDTDALKYALEGDLKNNCKPGEIETNYCFVKYIELNAKSPFFGGCSTLKDAIKFVASNKTATLAPYFIGISSCNNHPTLKKIFANTVYYQETGETNPRADENEVIHLGGDFGTLVSGVYRATSFFNPNRVTATAKNLVTGKEDDLQEWIDQENAKARLSYSSQTCSVL